MELQKITSVRVCRSVFMRRLIGRLQHLQLFSCDSQLVFVARIHRTTSTIRFGFDSRPVPKKLSTSMENTAAVSPIEPPETANRQLLMAQAIRWQREARVGKKATGRPTPQRTVTRHHPATGNGNWRNHT